MNGEGEIVNRGWRKGGEGEGGEGKRRGPRLTSTNDDENKHENENENENEHQNTEWNKPRTKRRTHHDIRPRQLSTAEIRSPVRGRRELGFEKVELGAEVLADEF